MPAVPGWGCGGCPAGWQSSGGRADLFSSLDLNDLPIVNRHFDSPVAEPIDGIHNGLEKIFSGHAALGFYA
jgi:hypothetical protein